MNKEDQGKGVGEAEGVFSAEMQKQIGDLVLASSVIGFAMMEKAMQGSLVSSLFNDYVQRRSGQIGTRELAEEILQSYQIKNESKEPGMKP